MNKALLLIAFSMILLGLNAQIPNSGFEDWEDEFLYEEPVEYVSSNFFSVVFTTQANVTKVDGVNGTSGIRLESVNSLNGPLAGLISNNEFGQGTLGGTPYTSLPDTFSGFVRHDLQVGDTAGIVILFKKDGQIINLIQHAIGGTNLAWEEFSVEIPPFRIAPDTVLFLVISSAGDVFPKSFIELDALRFNVAEQLPNADFEDWRDVRYIEPRGWTSVNLLAAINNDDISVTPSTDAVEGDFAARIESVWSSSSNDSTGLLYTNEQLNNVEGFPLTGRPAALRGFYKYTPIVPDDIAIAAIKLQYPDITNPQNNLDTTVVIVLTPTADYKQFDIDLTMINISTPDSATIYFESTNIFRQGRKGSVLFIDKLDLIPFTDLTEVQKIESLQINPNPATEWINIDIPTNVGTFTIHNNEGKVSLAGTLDNTDGRINVSQLQQGSYILSVKSNHFNAVGNFIKVN